MSKSPDKAPDNTDALKDKIIEEIRPKIQESFSELKNDIIADIQEIKKAVISQHKPQTEKPTLPIDSKEINDILKSVSGDKGADVSKILAAIKPMQTSLGDLPSDLTKAEYMQIRQQDQTQQMLMTILPLLLTNNNPMPEMFSQLMMRSFAESIIDNTTMRKQMNDYMSRKIGADLVKTDLGSLNPLANAMRSPIGTPTNPQEPTQ